MGIAWFMFGGPKGKFVIGMNERLKSGKRALP
jgi:hypothetical protein